MILDGIGVAFLRLGMSRIPAILLSALVVLTPVIEALCTDGCIEVGAVRSVEVVEVCGHGDVSGNAPALAAAACMSSQADFVVAEVRAIGPAIAPPASVINAAREPGRLPARDRYLQHQPPLPPAGTILRV